MGRGLAAGVALLVLLAASRAHAQSQLDEVVFVDGTTLYGQVARSSDDATLVLWIDGELHEYDTRDVRVVHYASPATVGRDALRPPNVEAPADSEWISEVTGVPLDAASVQPATQAELDESMDEFIAEANAAAPRLAVHHTESRESTRIGGWVMVVGSAAAGVGLVIGAVTMQRDPPPGGLYYGVETYTGYPSGRYPFITRRLPPGAGVLELLGFMVGIVGVTVGLGMTNARDSSTWGAPPRPDFTVARPIGPSF